MLKSIIITCCLAGAFVLRAGTPVQLNVEAGAFHPVLSPDASMLLYTSDDHTGLKAFDIASGHVTVIDNEAAAGFRPFFSTDGSTVYYRTASITDKMIYRDVRSYSFSEGDHHRLQAPSRGNQSAAAFSQSDYAIDDYKTISVCIDGKSTDISPLADAHSYLWASLSPDASRVAFSEPFTGVFVSAADGAEPVRLLPKGDYVAWAGPSTVIAVVSEDDGYGLLSSQLVAVNVSTGIARALTPDNVMVAEATASANGKVVYTDLDGQMFLLNIND